MSLISPILLDELHRQQALVTNSTNYYTTEVEVR